mgnify:CR=1 FL=1
MMDIGVTIRGLTSGLTPLCSSDQGGPGLMEAARSMLGRRIIIQRKLNDNKKLFNNDLLCFVA